MEKTTRETELLFVQGLRKIQNISNLLSRYLQGLQWTSIMGAHRKTDFYLSNLLFLEVMLTSAIVVFLPMGSELSISTGEPVSVLNLQVHWENNML